MTKFDLDRLKDSTRMFKTTNNDGSKKTCKFCHKPIWWHRFESRWYDPGGETLHVENCELRQEHFRHAALDAAEQRRQKR
jgi:hypothetical protein